MGHLAKWTNAPGEATECCDNRRHDEIKLMKGLTKFFLITGLFASPFFTVADAQAISFTYNLAGSVSFSSCDDAPNNSGGNSANFLSCDPTPQSGLNYTSNNPTANFSGFFVFDNVTDTITSWSVTITPTNGINDPSGGGRDGARTFAIGDPSGNAIVQNPLNGLIEFSRAAPQASGNNQFDSFEATLNFNLDNGPDNAFVPISLARVCYQSSNTGFGDNNCGQTTNSVQYFGGAVTNVPSPLSVLSLAPISLLAFLRKRYLLQ